MNKPNRVYFNGGEVSMGFGPRGDQYTVVVVNPRIRECRVRVCPSFVPPPFDRYDVEFEAEELDTNLEDVIAILQQHEQGVVVHEHAVKAIICSCNTACRDTLTAKFEHIMELHGDAQIVFILDPGVAPVDIMRSYFGEKGFVNVVARIDCEGGESYGAWLIWKDRSLLELTPNEVSGKLLDLTMTL